MKTIEQTDAFRKAGSRPAVRSVLWLAAGILMGLLSQLPALSADLPNDVLTRRNLFERQAIQLRQDFASSLPDEAFIKGPDGSVTGVNKNHPEYQRLNAEYEAGLQKAWNQVNRGDGRFGEIDQLCREAGIEQGIKNSGSRPKSINSDLDLTETAPGAGKKLADALGGKGYTVKELPDRWVIRETDTTIWKQQAAEQAGSAAHRAQQAQNATAEDIFATEGGKYRTSEGEMGQFGRTSRGKVGVLDPEGAVLANAKKFSEATGTGSVRRPDLPPEVQQIDGHTAGKSVSKAAEWTGTKHHDPDFFQKADALRSHKSWEDAGVCDHGDPASVKARKIQDFMQKAQEYMGKSADLASTQSRQLNDMRRKTAESYERQGLPEEAARVREKIVRTQVSNEETLKALVQRDPELAGRMRGMKLQRNPDGSFTDTATGRRMTSSQLEEVVTKPARSETVESTKETVPEKATTRSTLMKWGGRAIILHAAYEGSKQGAEQAVAEEKPGDSGLYTWTKATLYGIWNTTGIPSAWETGTTAGKESDNQFKKDLKEGKNPSGAWSILRGMVWGVGRFGKGMFVDPLIQGVVAIKEGVGLASDAASAQLQASRSKDFLRKARERNEQKARDQEGAEKRQSRIILTENWARMKNIPLTRGGDWLTSERDNARLKELNPDEYQHQIALILEQYDKLRAKLKKDGVLVTDKESERRLIYNLLWTKYRHPENFEKALADHYATFNKSYALLPTGEELSGRWSGGEFVMTDATISEQIIQGIIDAGTSPILAGCDSEKVKAAEVNLQKQLPKRMGLTFALRATSATTGVADLDINGADVKAKEAQQILHGLAYTVDGSSITLNKNSDLEKGASAAVQFVGKVQRTQDAWLLGGAWTIAIKFEGKTAILIKGTWSGKKGIEAE